MVVDGTLEAEISFNPASPTFSPNGKRLAYIPGKGQMWWAVVDAKAGPKFEGLARRGTLLSADEQVPGVTPPLFSPDSSHVTYAAHQSGRWGVLLDNERIGEMYNRVIYPGPSFREDGSLEFLGIRDRMLYRTIAKPSW